MKLATVTMALVLCFSRCLLAADAVADEQLVLSLREPITNFWGDRETKLSVVIDAKEAFDGELNWSLHAGERALITRVASVKVAAGDKTEVEVRYTLPAVKDAVVYPIELRAWAAAKGEAPVAELRESLYLFGANPFAERQQWLTSLKIHIFDPEDKTADAFEKVEIPFERITNPAVIGELREVVLIVGEDVQWEDYGELGSTLLQAAARGVRVLCLASATAEFALSSADKEAATAPPELRFRHAAALRDLDKRLSLHWTSNHAETFHTLQLTAENDRVLARATKAGTGWPWMEVRFPDSDGQQGVLVWCGLGVIRSWDDSPAPRYMLLKWLEKTSEQRAAGRD